MVTVMQVASAVVVSPAINQMIVIDTLRLTAESKDANGHEIVGSAFSWTSTDESVASVDDAGVVTALSAGEAEVTATSGVVSGHAEVVVSAREPTSVVVIPDTIDLLTEDTVRLTAEVRDQRHRVMEGRAVSWSSADAAVATVGSEGLVTAVNSGATTIFARAGAASVGTSRITVSLRHPSCTATSHPGDREWSLQERPYGVANPQSGFMDPAPHGTYPGRPAVQPPSRTDPDLGGWNGQGADLLKGAGVCGVATQGP